MAIAPALVDAEFQKFTQDIDQLLETKLSMGEAFFFASLLHLVFVKIHPFQDGNGRIGRLLEKWFFAEKLGEKSWFIQSEKNYYKFHESYYFNLRALDLEYEQLDYGKALPFLQMLPDALMLSK